MISSSSPRNNREIASRTTTPIVVVAPPARNRVEPIDVDRLLAVNMLTNDGIIARRLRLLADCDAAHDEDARRDAVGRSVAFDMELADTLAMMLRVGAEHRSGTIAERLLEILMPRLAPMIAEAIRKGVAA